MLHQPKPPLSCPGFLEAYPRISVGGFMRNADQGRNRVLWRDRLEQIVGVAAVLESERERLVIRYSTTDLVYDCGGEGDLRLALFWKGSNDDNHRPFAGCPECPRHVDVLVFRNEVWCCAGCHRLKHRSAMIRKEIRWAEEAAGLDLIANALTAPGVQRGQRDEARRKRDALLERLADAAPTASASYLRVLRTEYVALPGGWTCTAA